MPWWGAAVPSGGPFAHGRCILTAWALVQPRVRSRARRGNMGDEKTWQMFIGGEWVDSSSGETEPDIDPSTGEAVATVQIGTREDADRAVDAAQKAFDEVWFDTPPKERSAMLLQLADAIDADADNMALLESEDVGKP